MFVIKPRHYVGNAKVFLPWRGVTGRCAHTVTNLSCLLEAFVKLPLQIVHVGGSLTKALLEFSP